jgi:predicted amidophosphoribosyltransferase
LSQWSALRSLAGTDPAEVSLRELATLLAPPLCWACRAPARADHPLCTACRATLRWLGPRPVILAGVEAWAPVAYEGAARELVRALKYRGAERLAGVLAAQMAANAPGGLLAGALVPVPLHGARLRRRGYNQARLLAAALAERSGLELRDCLDRRGGDPPLAGRPRPERVALAGGGIVIQHDAGPLPDRVLLVDDVVTTGSTIAACAAALHSAGGRTVRAIAYARALAR